MLEKISKPKETKVKKSAQKIRVDNCVKTRFALGRVRCNCCSSVIQFELYYDVNEPEHTSFNIAKYCKNCVVSREEAFNLAFVKSVTAASLAMENEMKYLRHLVARAGEKMVVVEEKMNSIIAEALNRPSDEFDPVSDQFAMVAVNKASEVLSELEK
jgi:hypothetical protein